MTECGGASAGGARNSAATRSGSDAARSSNPCVDGASCNAGRACERGARDGHTAHGGRGDRRVCSAHGGRGANRRGANADPADRRNAANRDRSDLRGAGVPPNSNSCDRLDRPGRSEPKQSWAVPATKPPRQPVLWNCSVVVASSSCRVSSRWFIGFDEGIHRKFTCVPAGTKSVENSQKSLRRTHFWATMPGAAGISQWCRASSSMDGGGISFHGPK